MKSLLLAISIGAMWLTGGAAAAAIQEKPFLPTDPLGIGAPAGAGNENMSGYYVIDNQLYYYEQDSGEFMDLGPAASESGGKGDQEAAPRPKKTKKNRPSPVPLRTTEIPYYDEKKAAANLPGPAISLSSPEGSTPAAAVSDSATPAELSCAGWHSPLLPKQLYKTTEECQEALLDRTDAAQELLDSEEQRGLPPANPGLARPELRRAIEQGLTSGCRCTAYINAPVQ